MIVLRLSCLGYCAVLPAIACEIALKCELHYALGPIRHSSYINCGNTNNRSTPRQSCQSK